MNDYQVVREGIKLMLNVPSADVQVVGEAGSFQELFAVLPDTEANIVLLDLLLPGIGLEATSYLKGHCPALKVLILSMMDQEHYVAQALRAAAAEVLKLHSE